MGPYEAGVRESIKELYYAEKVLGDVPFEHLSTTANSVVEVMRILLKSAIDAQTTLAKEFRAERK